MPREEVSEISSTYAALDYLWQQYQPVIDALAQCTLYLTQTSDATTLSPAEIPAEIQSLKLAIEREAIYGNTLSLLGHLPGFGPIPSWWQMLPFFKMQDYYAWARQHPELKTLSQHDIDAARAHAGLPPEQGPATFNYYTSKSATAQ
jgi:hypothetical protein